MKYYNVAIVGATGAVGQEMIRVLHELQFPYQQLRLFASKNSAGKTICIDDQYYQIEEFHNTCLEGMDIVLGASSQQVAKEIAKQTKASGALFIDNSSTFRLQNDVPLVIPEVNADDYDNHHGIIANPNCATIIALTALQPLHAYAKIKRLIVSTYQAVSGAGMYGIQELQQQLQDIAQQKQVKIQHFPYQIAYNAIPQIGDFDTDGFTGEELKLEKESKKILHNDSLIVNCTCVRVPILRSHSESIYVEFEKALDVEKAKTLLQQAQGVRLVDNPTHMQYPMPLDTSYQDLVYVGRIRKDPNQESYGLSLWCCGDQLRKGAATNAIQIAKIAIEKGFSHAHS